MLFREEWDTNRLAKRLPMALRSRTEPARDILVIDSFAPSLTRYAPTEYTLLPSP
jgi:hypothetical protein